MVARGRKIWCARRGVAAMRWHAPMQGRDPREIPGRSQGEIRGASLRSSDGQNGMGPLAVCALCALCCCRAAAWLPPPSARARVGYCISAATRQALIMNDPGPVRPIASGRTSRTQVADTDTTDDTHLISGTRHGSRVTRELERTISRRTKHHRTSLLRADPEQDRRRGASVTLSRSLMAISHSTPGRLT